MYKTDFFFFFAFLCCVFTIDLIVNDSTNYWKSLLPSYSGIAFTYLMYQVFVCITVTSTRIIFIKTDNKYMKCETTETDRQKKKIIKICIVTNKQNHTSKSIQRRRRRRRGPNFNQSINQSINSILSYTCIYI